jgi:hypothetical protein
MNLAANADRSAFQWNAGTWLGAQLGGTGWLLGGALYMLLAAPEVSAIWFTGFVILNAIGWALWRRRDRLRAHTAVQLLFAAIGIVGVVAWTALLQLRPDIPRRELWPTNYWPLAIIPAMMLWFAIREHLSQRATP